VTQNPEAAAERLQAFVESREWPLRAVKRLTLMEVQPKQAHGGNKTAEQLKITWQQGVGPEKRARQITDYDKN
jgi:hypothetical protein